MKKKRSPTVPIVAIAAGLPVFAVALFFGTAYLLPVDKKDFSRDSFESYRIRDRHGRLVREAVGASGERARYLAYPDLPELVIKATIAVEDRNFYAHCGVDFGALLRAAWQDASSGKMVSGASTITMQLARIMTGARRDVFGKIAQAWTALRLERVFSKNEILEMYLNSIPYGNGALGIESASLVYFDKPASHLDLSEAAFLAGLPQAPGLLDPFASPEKAERRRRQVLQALADSGALGEGEIRRALSETPVLNHRPQKITAGHFTDYVLSLNPPPGDVMTTLDADLNDQIQDMVGLHVDQYREKGLTNAAVVMIDNPTGEIRALVGSRDWNDPREGSVNGALARRQPGSALKPFAYELALEKGVKPNLVLPDVETEYYGTDRTLYIPRNYSQTYRGPVIFQEALTLSLNVPAIKLVEDHVGVGSFLARLRELGFSGLRESEDYYGLGLVLGNGEVSALELAGAYSALARGGILIPPTPFPRADGEGGRRVMDEKASALITAILSDESLRLQSFGVSNPLLFGFPLAVKTGTSSQWRDTWTVGYTSAFTLVVWAGNFDAEPMDGLPSVTGAGVLFGKIVKFLHARDPGLFTPPPAPPGLKKVTVCSWSGLLCHEYCPKTSTIYTYDDIRDYCDVHRLVPAESVSEAKAGRSASSGARKVMVVTSLPPEYDGWLKEKGYPVPQPGPEKPKSVLSIVKPREGDTYIIEPGYNLKTQTIEFQLAAAERPRKIDWYLNGKPIAAAQWPYSLDWRMQKGKYTLEARSPGRKSEAVHFEVK
jgi:penicillin-binding protein 1C